jgi:hypothetical protein
MARVVIYYVLVFGNRSLTTVTVKKRKKYKHLLLAPEAPKPVGVSVVGTGQTQKFTSCPEQHTLFLFSSLSLSLITNIICRTSGRNFLVRAEGTGQTRPLPQSFSFFKIKKKAI